MFMGELPSSVFCRNSFLFAIAFGRYAPGKFEVPTEIKGVGVVNLLGYLFHSIAGFGQLSLIVIDSLHSQPRDG
jgi:hypothetical protein